MKQLKLKRHETFSIREGWIEKGIHYINQYPKCMFNDNGTKTFGLGSNMVKSLRYWLIATDIAKFTNGIAELTELGNLLLKYDPYLDNMFSWWLIHLNLAMNLKDNTPVFNAIINLEYSQFDKTILLDRIPLKLLDLKYENITSTSSLESDISIFLKSYYTFEHENPENNMSCPLAKLGLFKYENKRYYVRKMPAYNKLDFRIVYLCLIKSLGKRDIPYSFNIEDIYAIHNSPLQILNLSKPALFRYLDDMQKNGYIHLNKTAGLNVVYIDKAKNLTEIASSFYEGVEAYV